MASINGAQPLAELQRAESAVEAHSGVFKKELGLSDVVLAQLLIVLGTFGPGLAAKVGPSSLVLWLLAMLLFYLPLAVTVTHLNRLMPLEGGLYQWAKLGHNEFVGFLVGWNTWLFVVTFLSSEGLMAATGLSYALGPGAEWMAGNKLFVSLSTCVVIGALALVSVVGLKAGKWVQNAGGVILLTAYTGLLLLPLVSAARGEPVNYSGLSLSMPEASVVNLTIFTKMAAYCLAGFEYVAIFAGECRNPARTISRSVMIAAPVIALLYILATASVLAFVRPEDVDLINPAAQVFSRGARALGAAGYVVPIVILATVFRERAQSCCIFAGGARLPMVAGWDDLLPAWFARLHSKYRTPVNSIIFVAVVALTLGLVSLIDAGQQEAYQLLLSANGIFVATGYLAMFLIPLAGLRGRSVRFPPGLKAAAASGLLVTMLFIALSIYPIIDVASPIGYALKISGVVIITNAIGVSIYLMARRKFKVKERG